MQASRQAFCRVEVRAPDAERAERAVAEAYAAGAVGLEERGASDGIALLVYAPAAAIEAVRGALTVDGVRVIGSEPVPPADWSEAWKAHLEPVVVSARLVVRA
ncbi:MAG: hypothetical protein ABFS41_20300, partial [Myxococcota bacterium]